MTSGIVPSGTLRFIRCSVQDESYGIDMTWVRSIQRSDQLKREAGDNGSVGWLPSREGNIPVYDLANRLGRAANPFNSQGRIIILNLLATGTMSVATRGTRPWALLVDHVSQVIQIPMDRLIPLSAVAAHSLSNYFRGVIRLEEALVLFLAPEQLHPDAPPRAEQPASYSVQLEPGTNHPTNGNAPSGTQKARREKQILLFSTTEPLPGARALSFALSITQVPEILNAVPLTRVPGAPSFVLGLVNWRNRPVPVIDLNMRLGLPSSTSSLNGRSRLLIVRSPNESGADVFAGLIIHPKVRAVRLPLASTPCQSSLPIEKRLVSGIVDLE
ncbi:partial Chemotaxis protein CheW, partial [uncultured bacterium]